MGIRPTVTMSFVLAGFLTAAAAGAQSQPAPAAGADYVGTTANMTPGGGTSLSIQILKRSTDAEREKVLAITTAADGPGKGLDATPTVGYVWTGSSIGYSLKYAERQPMSEGGERVVVVTDRPLGSWERPGPWKAAKPAGPELPFTVIELHVNAAGVGQGKMSFAAPFAADKDKKTLALVGYDTAPILLQGVKRKKAGTN